MTGFVSRCQNFVHFCEYVFRQVTSNTATRAGEHPGMHRTDTVDYALMLDGELVAILENAETTLKAGARRAP